MTGADPVSQPRPRTCQGLPLPGTGNELLSPAPAAANRAGPKSTWRAAGSAPGVVAAVGGRRPARTGLAGSDLPLARERVFYAPAGRRGSWAESEGPRRRRDEWSTSSTSRARRDRHRGRRWRRTRRWSSTPARRAWDDRRRHGATGGASRRRTGRPTSRTGPIRGREVGAAAGPPSAVVVRGRGT